MMGHAELKALAAAALLSLGALAPAGAECSRDIAVPVALIGVSITNNNGTVGGIYPEALRAASAKAGCNLVFSVVPRARLEVLFEIGKADILVPASRTAARDQLGIFVPMIGHRATLISVQGNRAPITSAQELLDKHELRVAVVRGYDYGEQYQALIKELAKQGRLFQEVDTVAIARLMQSGAIDVTIMGPTTFSGAVMREPRVAGLMDKLRVEPIPELPWSYSGAYVSRRSLKPEDQAAVLEVIEKVAKSSVVMEGFQRYHRADILAESVRPR
ncbi:transporter substrate-binding domain-containing protein [Pseudoduganella sp. LjRoot289]|uniref:substrate-binding periplasmic protein n=1 Tax=Pseudoduganella sp. LjRoot289 TaxID=3342314 RepID=UPI003ECCCEA4